MSERIALVTGANKGIGLQVAYGLAMLGFVVGVGSRDRLRGEAAVATLRDAGGDVFWVPLDVTDDASVATSATVVRDRFGRLDVLVNNAGITGGSPQTPSTTDPATFHAVVDTNVVGAIRVTNAMLPLLRTSLCPRIVNVSSRSGSLTLQSTPGLTVGSTNPVAYASSKTMLNAVTIHYAKELATTRILINAVCPGYTATDLNEYRGSRTPQQGAAIVIQLATLPDNGPTGQFFDEAGPVPW